MSIALMAVAFVRVTSILMLSFAACESTCICRNDSVNLHSVCLSFRSLAPQIGTVLVRLACVAAMSVFTLYLACYFVELEDKALAVQNCTHLSLGNLASVTNPILLSVREYWRASVFMAWSKSICCRLLLNSKTAFE